MSDFCNIKDCENEIYARGLCSKHYQKYFYRVKQGLTTWQELVEKGLADPGQGKVLDIGKPNPANSDNIVSFNLHIPTVGGTMHTVYPDPSGKDLSKKEVLEKVKDHLRNNSLDGLLIVIFQLKK